MDGIEIRIATASDIANISQLLSDTFYQFSGFRSLLTPLLRMGLCYDLASRLQPSNKRYQCLLAEIPSPNQPNRLVGTVEVAIRSLSLPSLRLPQKAYISNLAVQERYRQKGIGQMLLNRCETIAQSWEQPEIFLHVRRDNAIALGLYQKLGYKNTPQRSPLERNRNLLMKKLSDNF